MKLAILLTLCGAQAGAASCTKGSCRDDEVSLLQTKVDTLQGSDLETLRSQGYSQGMERIGDAVTAAAVDLQTGEMGETIYHPMHHPNLYRTTFASKGEEALRNDRVIMEDQVVIDQMYQDMLQALTQLKAEVYHSADASRWRQQQLQITEVKKRRMQLLATLNMQKADNTKISAEQYKQASFWEKELHNAEAQIYEEREKRRKIWKQEMKEQKEWVNKTTANASSTDGVTKELAMDRRNITDWEKQDTKNITKELKDGAYLKDFDKGLSTKDAIKQSDELIDAYQEFLHAIGRE